MRTELTFYIGYRVLDIDFEQEIIEVAKRCCGGCLYIPVRGYWEDTRPRHAERLAEEPTGSACFQLKLFCENHKRESVCAEMKAGIRRAAQKYRVCIDYRHVHATEFIDLSFSGFDRGEPGSE